MSTPHTSPTSTQSHPGGSRPATFSPQTSKLAIGLLTAVLVPLIFITFWSGSMGKPNLRHEPVAYASTAAAPKDLASTVTSAPQDAFAWRKYASMHDVAVAVREGEISTGVVFDKDRIVLYENSANSVVKAQAMKTAFLLTSQMLRMPFEEIDLHPSPEGDPSGIAVYLMVLGWVIGGGVSAFVIWTALGRVTTINQALTSIFWQLTAAFIVAIYTALIMTLWLHMIDGDAWQIVAVGTVCMFVTSFLATTAALFIGRAGVLLVLGVLFLVGAPTSGGSIPMSMLPTGWQAIGNFLPTSAMASLLRQSVYFPDRPIAHAAMHLIYWFAFALLLVAAKLTLDRVVAHRAIPRTDDPELVNEGS